MTSRALSLLLLAFAPACGGAGVHRIPPVPSDPEARAKELEARLSEGGPSAAVFADLAQARLSAGQPAAAGVMVARALALDPRHPGAHVVSARIARERGDLESAARHYEEAASSPGIAERLDGERGDVLVSLAEHEADLGRPRSAVEVLEELRRVAPDSARRLRSRRAKTALRAAEALVSEGRGTAALEAAALARAAGAEADVLRFVEGRARFLAGDEAEALRHLEAWAQGPDRARRFATLGSFLLDHQEEARALEAFREAVKGPRAEPDAFVGLARAAVRAGAPAEAAGAWRSLAAGAGDPASRARTLARGADEVATVAWQEANRLYEEAFALDPGSHDLVAAWGDLLAAHGEALAILPDVLRRHLEAHAGDVEAVRRAASLLVKANMPLAAEGLLEAEAGRPGADPELWLDLAKLLHARRARPVDRNAAIDRYVRHVREVEGDGPALVPAARLLLDLKERVRALDLAKKAVAAAPDDVSVGLLMADVHRSVGRAADEEKTVLDLVARSGGSIATLLLVGERYVDLGDSTSAVRWLERALPAARGDELRRAHRLLWRAHLAARPPEDRAAARHMRSWLALAPEPERARALEALLAPTLGNRELASLRVDVLTELSALQPGDPTLTDELGQLHLEAQRWADARRAWERHLQVTPRPQEAAIRIAEAFRARQRQDEALSFFDRVDPALIRDPLVQHRLGMMLVGRGQPERARVHFRLFLDLATPARHRSDLRAFAGKMLQLREQDLAAEACERLLAHDADDRDAMRHLAVSLVRRGRYDEAKGWFERYVEAAPPAQRHDAIRTVGDEYQKEGRLPEAARAFHQWLLEERPGAGGENFARLSELYLWMGDLDGLRQAVRDHVARSRQPPQAAVEAATALERAGLPDEAGKLLEEALASRQTHENLLRKAVEVGIRRGRLEEARALLERSVRLRGGTEDAWVQAAKVLEDAALPREALAFLESATKEVPGSDVLLARGRLQVLVGDHDEAEASFVAALTQAASVRAVVESVEKAWSQADQDERLRRFLARATALSPGDAEIPLALGRLALGAGELEEARQAFALHLSQSERGHLRVAQAWGRAGHVSEALEHYARAWEQPGAGPEELPLKSVVDLLVAHGRTAELETFARLHLQRAKDPLGAAVEVSKAWLDAGDPERALATLERIEEARPDVDRDLERGRLLLLLDRPDDARVAFDRYVDRKLEGQMSGDRLFPTGGAARSSLHPSREVAAIHDRRGEVSEALRAIRREAALYGDDPQLAIVESRLLVSSGDAGAAMERLRRLREPIDPDDPELGFLLDALERRGRDAEALEVLDLPMAKEPKTELSLRRLRLLAARGRHGEVEAETARLVADAATKDGRADLLAVGRVAFESGLRGLARRVLQASLDSAGSDRTTASWPVRATAIRLLAALDRMEGREVDAESRIDAAPLRFDLYRRQAVAADRAYADGRFDDAARSAEAAIAVDPTDREVFVTALLSHAMRGDAPSVLRVIDRYRPDVRPDKQGEGGRLRVLEDAARILEAAHHPEMALEVAVRIADIEAGKPARHLDVVRHALDAGFDRRAREASERLLSITGAEPEVVLSVAGLWADRLRGAEARDLLARLPEARRAPGLRASLVLAQAALAEGDVEAAVAALAEAVTAAPDAVVTRFEAARILLAWGVAAEEAHAHVAPVARAGGAPTAALALAAEAAWRAGWPEKARGWARLWLARKVHADGELVQLLAGAVAGGDPEGLRLVLSGAPASVGDLAWRSDVLATLRRALEDEAERLGSAEKRAIADVIEELLGSVAQAWSGEDPGLAMVTGTLAEARDDVERAIEAYEHALVRDPGSPLASNNLAYLLADHGRDLPVAARLVADARLRSWTPSSSVVDTEAWVLHRQGRVGEALDRIRWALQLDPRSREVEDGPPAEIVFHLGAIREAAGDRSGARAAFAACARYGPARGFGARCLARYRMLDGSAPRPAVPAVPAVPASPSSGGSGTRSDGPSQTIGPRAGKSSIAWGTRGQRRASSPDGRVPRSSASRVVSTGPASSVRIQ